MVSGKYCAILGFIEYIYLRCDRVSPAIAEWKKSQAMYCGRAAHTKTNVAPKFLGRNICPTRKGSVPML